MASELCVLRVSGECGLFDASWQVVSEVGHGSVSCTGHVVMGRNDLAKSPTVDIDGVQARVPRSNLENPFVFTCSLEGSKADFRDLQAELQASGKECGGTGTGRESHLGGEPTG